MLLQEHGHFGLRNRTGRDTYDETEKGVCVCFERKVVQPEEG